MPVFHVHKLLNDTRITLSTKLFITDYNCIVSEFLIEAVDGASELSHVRTLLDIQQFKKFEVKIETELHQHTSF